MEQIHFFKLNAIQNYDMLYNNSIYIRIDLLLVKSHIIEREGKFV